MSYWDTLKIVLIDIHHTEKKERQKMRKIKNRIVTIVIAIFLMISMSASMMLISNVKAQSTAENIPTYAYIHAAPDPVGVGQQVTIYIWLDKVLPDAAIGNDIRFHNYELTITAPNGTTSSQTFATISDTTSSQYTLYTPTQTGTYNLNFTFPGMTYTYNETVANSMTGGTSSTASYVGDYYEPSNSSTTFTVQSSPIAVATGSSPLPTEYWTRPIYGENNYWYTISSNWLGTGAPGYSGTANNGANQQSYPGDAVGPTTSHVMWTKPLQSGGVVGGNDVAIAGDTYFEGSAYLNRFTNPIILDGMLFYTEPIGFTGVGGGMGSSSGTRAYGPTVCVNLQTGQQIWSRTDVPAPSFGYIYDQQDPNQHGVWPPVLIATSGGSGTPGAGASSTTWIAFDADTGDWLFNMTNVPTGTTVLGPSGEMLTYVLANDGTPANPSYYLGEWNSSRLAYAGGSITPSIQGTVVDASVPSAYDWNISIPSLNTMTTTPTILDAFYHDMLICMNGTYPSPVSSMFGTLASSAPYTYIAINLNATIGNIGSALWWNTVNAPAGNLTVLAGPADPTTGVFTEAYKETMQFVGYSMATGAKLWGPTASQTAFDYYGTPYFPDVNGVTAYGNIYSSSFGGIIYCYNDSTGALEWTYGNGGEGNSTNAGFNAPYGDYPTFIYAIGNGIVYTVTTEHTIETPIYKGALARAINATDGTEIWTLSNYDGGLSATAIADGYATLFNGYDNQIYSIGRGPSATTVSAPDIAASFGTPVVISGTVTDISAGTKQTEQAADFPNGVPCSSDASMTAWMGYVYQQQPIPTNFTGVPVQIYVLDSNGNHRLIGTAMTDTSGTYSLAWTPDIAGNYTVYAQFAGTNGYWPSSAEAGFVVMNAPTATVTPSATPTSVADMYFVPAIAGIFVVLIIVLALVVLGMLRKRP